MNDIKGIIEDVEKSSLVSNKVIQKVIEIIGQEKWNYIHDEESDICTTTGELIITLKGIAELEKQSKVKKQQLTKAKEIIKNILRTLKNEGSDWTFALKNTHHVLLEAEQFLKEASE